MVSLPVLAAALFVALALRAWTPVGPSSWMIGGLCAWPVWSVLVPRWRDWVCSHDVDLDRVQRLAQGTGLVWARGSFIERTELPRRNGRRGW